MQHRPVVWRATQMQTGHDAVSARLKHRCLVLSRSLALLAAGLAVLGAIDRPNFGVIYEPANLELCGEDYGPETVKRLAPWIFNVYLQNQVLKPDGKMTLQTWRRGPVSFDLPPIHRAGGINFSRVFEALADIKYDGPITVHQAQVEDETVQETVRRTADYLRKLGFGE